MEARYLRLVIALATAALLCVCAEAESNVSHEEQVVRTAYAKLAYAAQECVLLNAALTDGALLTTPAQLRGRMDTDVPDFELTNFSVGTLASVADLPWDRFVTKPQGDLVAAVPTSLSYAGKEMKCVSVGWNQGTHNFDNDWNIPVSKVIADTAKPQGTSYIRYAAYNVNITLQRTARMYKAMFLFGTDASGKEVVFPIDHILGMGTLNVVMEHSFYPEILLETSMRALPGIREWIASSGVECPTQRRDVCCNPVSGKCGLPKGQLEKSRAVILKQDDHYALPPKREKGGSQ